MLSSEKYVELGQTFFADVTDRAYLGCAGQGSRLEGRGGKGDFDESRVRDAACWLVGYKEVARNVFTWV